MSTRQELENKFMELAYARITGDYMRMTQFVWDNLSDNAQSADDDTLLNLIALYSDED